MKENVEVGEEEEGGSREERVGESESRRVGESGLVDASEQEYVVREGDGDLRVRAEPRAVDSVDGGRQLGHVAHGLHRTAHTAHHTYTFLFEDALGEDACSAGL